MHDLSILREVEKIWSHFKYKGKGGQGGVGVDGAWWCLKFVPQMGPWFRGRGKKVLKKGVKEREERTNKGNDADVCEEGARRGG